MLSPSRKLRAEDGHREGISIGGFVIIDRVLVESFEIRRISAAIERDVPLRALHSSRDNRTKSRGGDRASS